MIPEIKAVMPQRVLMIDELIIRTTKTIMGIGKARIYLQCGEIIFYRFVYFYAPSFQQCIRKIVICPRMVRIGGDRSIEILFRFYKLLPFEIDRSYTDQCLRLIRIIVQRFAIQFEGEFLFATTISKGSLRKESSGSGLIIGMSCGGNELIKVPFGLCYA